MPSPYDPHTNFPYSVVQAGSTVIGTTANGTIKLAAGDGAHFPGGDGSTQFNVVLAPPGTQPLWTNAEVARVTRSGDTCTTVTRGVEGTSALAGVAAGWQVFAAITAKVLTDIEASAIGFRGCLVYNTGDLVLTQGPEVVMAFNAEDKDTDAFHDNAVNNSRITIPTGLGGTYEVSGKTIVTNGAAAAIGLTIRKNGTVYLDEDIQSAAGDYAFNSYKPPACHVFWVGDLVQTDYVEMTVSSKAAGSFTIGGRSGADPARGPLFRCRKIG